MVWNSQRHLAVSIGCLRLKRLLLMNYLILRQALPLSGKGAVGAQLSRPYSLESSWKLLSFNDDFGLLQAILP